MKCWEALASQHSRMEASSSMDGDLKAYHRHVKRKHVFFGWLFYFSNGE